VFSDSGLKKIVIVGAFVLVALIFGYHVFNHPMDFRVYHYGARGVFDGTRPVYGPTSGLGWPMHYRYPPLFLLLFAPFAMLPLGWSAALWVVLKVGILAWLLHAFWKRGLKPPTVYASFTVLLLIGPYIVEEFRYGNAQFFVVALMIAALMRLRERPVLGAGSLALAISLKVFPLFFIPYLVARREWKFVSYTLVFVLSLALLPATYFGVSGNFRLLGEWFTQESHTQLSESEIWFPNQSLRGVLMRYLTLIDYSQVPDSNYPLVNVAAIDAAKVRLLWMVLAGGIYAGFLFLANRRREVDGWIDHGLAFCLLALLEPFTQKYALIVLLCPAIVAGGLLKERRFRILIYSAIVLVLIQPLAPGSNAQRLLQVLGLDFVAALLIAIAFVSVGFTPAFNHRNKFFVS
jgi:glycosyl transferase family 87